MTADAVGSSLSSGLVIDTSSLAKGNRAAGAPSALTANSPRPPLRPRSDLPNYSVPQSNSVHYFGYLTVYTFFFYPNIHSLLLTLSSFSIKKIYNLRTYIWGSEKQVHANRLLKLLTCPDIFRAILKQYFKSKILIYRFPLSI